MNKDEKQLDILWSKAVKERAGNKCELCSKKDCLSAHHIINKSKSKGLRWKIENGMCLCFYHHRMAHDYPDKFKEKIKNMVDYNKLEYMGNQVSKYIDLKEEEKNIKKYV
ncbi:hypothetical protein EOM09_04835 [bacterium]|nr:hypothetical protein [bacterium]